MIQVLPRACLKSHTIAGQDDYSFMRLQYTQSAAGFVLAYAIDSRSSFDAIVDLHQSIVQRNPAAVIVVVGTKSDLESARQVSLAWLHITP